MRLQLTLTNRYLSKKRQMISRGWSEWAHATRTSAIAEVQQQLAAERSTVKTFALLAKCAHDPLRALRRLDQLDAWRALQTWVSFTTVAVVLDDQRQTAATTVIRLLVDGRVRLERAALRAWVDWCAYVSDAERACRLATRVLRHLEHVAEAAAMRAWERFCRYAAVRDHDTIVATLRQNEAVTRALRLLQSSSARSLAAAWGGWRMDAQDARKRKTLMRRVMGRLASQLAAQARVVQVNFSLGRQSSNIRLPLGTLDKFAMP